MMKHLMIFVAAAVIILLAGCRSVPRVSVLGDSYSTFQSWIPEGNACWYPYDNTRNDVRQPEECWWYLTTKAIGGKLEANESWSGSTVCYTSYNGADGSAWSFVERTGRLGNPTLILVCGATNDCWAGAPIGEYKWADWTREELFTFRPAMAKMLADLQEKYPKARIIFVLNSELSEPINESVHEICAHYDVECVDLHDIEKQEGHPSVLGMKAMADQVVKTINR